MFFHNCILKLVETELIVSIANIEAFSANLIAQLLIVFVHFGICSLLSG